MLAKCVNEKCNKMLHFKACRGAKLSDNRCKCGGKFRVMYHSCERSALINYAYNVYITSAGKPYKADFDNHVFINLQNNEQHEKNN